MPDLQRNQARDKASALAGASPRYVQDAKQIAKDALEVLDYVQHGKPSVPHTKQVAAHIVTIRQGERTDLPSTVYFCKRKR